jgi:hypothetical protein
MRRWVLGMGQHSYFWPALEKFESEITLQPRHARILPRIDRSCYGVALVADKASGRRLSWNCSAAERSSETRSPGGSEQALFRVIVSRLLVELGASSS